MCRKDHRLIRFRYLVEFFHKNGAFGSQRLDHESVVNDLVADVDRGAELGQGELDDLNGPVDAGAEAARRGENHRQSGGAPLGWRRIGGEDIETRS